MKRILENKIMESFTIDEINRWKLYDGVLENKQWKHSLLYKDTITGAVLERDSCSRKCLLSGIQLSDRLCEAFTNLLDARYVFMQNRAEADLCELFGVSSAD